MIESPQFSQRYQNPQTILFIQRVMVGCIILYDHVHLLGAFSKKNPAIDVCAFLADVQPVLKRCPDPRMHPGHQVARKPAPGGSDQRPALHDEAPQRRRDTEGDQEYAGIICMLFFFCVWTRCKTENRQLWI